MSRPMKDMKLAEQNPKSIPNDPFRCVKPNTPSLVKPKAGLGLKDIPHPFKNGKEKP